MRENNSLAASSLNFFLQCPPQEFRTVRIQDVNRAIHAGHDVVGNPRPDEYTMFPPYRTALYFSHLHAELSLTQFNTHASFFLSFFRVVLNKVMPGVRSEGQTMIGCWCEESFMRKIDRARGALTRSQFCRDALTEKLKEMRIHVELHEQYAPDRKGKGGPTKEIGSYRADAKKQKRRTSSKPPSVSATHAKLLDAAEETDKKNRES